MAGIPKVKITFDADFDELKKGIKGGQAEIETFGSRVGEFGKKAAAAFAVAGVAAAAYAGKLLIDGVKSAIEDEAAQAKLAITLKNVAGATDATVAATEAYILKTSLATGMTDNDLRPSLERLARSTGDLQKAQQLQTLALDIAAGSGKSLEAVSNALGKAYEGNSGALAKLGVGLSAAELKTMSMDQVTKALSNTFGGQAATAADSFQGKMARLTVAFDEGKETVGSFVLDAITPLVTTIVEDVIPKLSELATNIGETLGPAFSNLVTFFKDNLIPIFKEWWSFLTDIIIPAIVSVVKPAFEGLQIAFSLVSKAIKDNEDKLVPFFVLIKQVYAFVLNFLAPVFGTILKTAFIVIGELISGLITGFGLVADVITTVIDAIKALINIVRNNPLVRGISNLIENTFGGGRALGGSVIGGTSYLVGERGAELFTPSQSGTVTPNNRLGGNTIINLNVSGAIDSEGTARTIINTLNNSFFRGTGGASNLQTT
jgi:hypothetical protein